MLVTRLSWQLAFTGQEEGSPRGVFCYVKSDSGRMELVHKNRKMHFMVQDQKGTLEIWRRKFRGLRMPYIVNLHTDPYKHATITSDFNIVRD